MKNLVHICSPSYTTIDAFKFTANLSIPFGLKWRPLHSKWSTVIFLYFTIGKFSSFSRSFSFKIVKHVLLSSTRVIACNKVSLQLSLKFSNAVLIWRSLSRNFLEVMPLALLVSTCKKIVWFPFWKMFNVVKHIFNSWTSATDYFGLVCCIWQQPLFYTW